MTLTHHAVDQAADFLSVEGDDVVLGKDASLTRLQDTVEPACGW